MNSNSMGAKNCEKYRDKIILAPMVRIGTLPMRLLALEFGADLVYTEELIDWKIVRCYRRINDALGTVDFIDETDGTVVFRTCSLEKDRVISSWAHVAPKEPLKLLSYENDVAGIDINMGCPKEFSLKGGMGAALLSEPEKAKSILKMLTSNLTIPVTCKIRVLDNDEDTIELCKEFESCGISAIAVHGRTKNERPQHQNRNESIKYVSKNLSIPVIANGGSKDIEVYKDIIKFKRLTGCDSVMIARAAQWNVSVFNKKGKLDTEEMIIKYLKLAITYDNSPCNTKYCIQNILRDLQESELGKKFLEAQTLLQMSTVWGIEEFYNEIYAIHEEKGVKGRRDVRPTGHKRLCLDPQVTAMECAYIRSIYPKDTDLPKTKLLTWTQMNKTKIPKYKTVQMDKLFQSTVTVNDKQYTSTFWEKNKRWAEQGAATVCLCSLGVLDETFLKKNGVLRTLN